MQTHILFVRTRPRHNSGVLETEYGLLRYNKEQFAPISLEEKDVRKKLSACLKIGVIHKIKDCSQEDTLVLFLPEKIALKSEGKFWWASRCNLYKFHRISNPSQNPQFVFPEIVLIMADLFDDAQKK